ncbi:hypothetical protein Rhopal_000573-T1 [Rhodotorula paludigena]|uniref:Uncharacterized protein n=1 Tax=Rhodotorula paludigena TaxID=86838 RepID=A0AAV5GBE2_9BASI|nr:hypothetical protein Rhopal_000573-T1 [Rhodotorula paludigena]
MQERPAKRQRLSPDVDLTLDDAPATARVSPVKATKPPTNQQKIASIFQAPSQRASKGSWQKNLGTGKGCGHFVHGEPPISAKVAAFDIDGTLIKTKSGNKFPSDANDFAWLNSKVIPKLRELHADGYAIVLFSNQGVNAVKLSHFRKKLPLLANALEIPFRAFAAFDFNEFRKPAPGMWDAFVHQCNGGVVDYDTSFYVGDAAGRPADWNDTDRKFAINCGLTFFTPEEFFLGKPVSNNFSLKGWDPKTHDHSVPLYSPLSEFDEAPAPEVVIFVGFPGSGKTSFYSEHFAPKGYVHVNQDTLRTRDRCLALVRECLTSTPPRSCVVDNTSPAVETRAAYLELVRALNAGQTAAGGKKVRVRCFHFTAPVELAMHNSVYRALADSTIAAGAGASATARRDVLPMAAFTRYRQNFAAPTLAEGFDDLKRIHFRFSGPPGDLAKWQRYLGDVYSDSDRKAVGLKPLGKR